MARLPVSDEVIINQWGPHLAFNDAPTIDTQVVADKLVDTHCCFCGQQCGIKLKVKDNRVIGFEPRYDFPFNRGMLCPKGVKRYLQGGHTDRLERALQRDESVEGGFREIEYDFAMKRVASEIARVQEKYGHDAVGVLSGASLTTEKAYLMGKFARVCLKTPYIDYNGRLCMVSAAAANKLAFGVDRAANAWEDIIGADVVWISGANIAECAPITTDYVWQAREMGGKIIVVDPRITPIARTADIFLPVRPGCDAALFNGVLHLMIENDWLDHDFIAAHTVDFDELKQHVPAMDPGSHGRSLRHLEEKAARSGRAMGDCLDQLLTACARNRTSLQWRPKLFRCDQHRYGVGTDWSQELRLRDDNRPSERTGRSGTRTKVRSAPGCSRHSQSGASPIRCRGLGHR